MNHNLSFVFRTHYEDIAGKNEVVEAISDIMQVEEIPLDQLAMNE